MTITVNGEPKSLPDGATVRSLIETLGLGKAACAAEVNRELVPRRAQDSRRLQEGDVVELVTLVGGG
ncbi:MAG: sulfur carrier protein ThiS [Phycisphaerales bacterium]|nr:sulfur carrier protein ThiS [Phycisphaerales bacterium]